MNVFKAGDKCRLRPDLKGIEIGEYLKIAPFHANPSAIVTISRVLGDENAYGAYFEEIKVGWCTLKFFEKVPEMQEIDPEELVIDLFEDDISSTDKLKIIFNSHNINFDGSNLVDAVAALSNQKNALHKALRKIDQIQNTMTNAIREGYYP